MDFEGKIPENNVPTLEVGDPPYELPTSSGDGYLEGQANGSTQWTRSLSIESGSISATSFPAPDALVSKSYVDTAINNVAIGITPDFSDLQTAVGALQTKTDPREPERKLR